MISSSVGDLWLFGADPYLWLMDPNPTSDPTSFVSDWVAKKIIFFSKFFSYNLTTGTFSSVLKIKFFPPNFVLKSYLASIISEKIRIRIHTSD